MQSISVVYILREPGQNYLFVFSFSCLLWGRKEKKSKKRSEKRSENEYKRVGKKTKGVERLCA